MSSTPTSLTMNSVMSTNRPPKLRSRFYWGLFVKLGLLFPGWFLVLAANRWHLGVPTVALMVGWFCIVWTSWYLWAAASHSKSSDDDEFFRPLGRREQLLDEKKSLLKAIKEIEFDREMRKMSPQDAKQLTQYYRARAIEVIKMLETQGDPSSVEAQIDGEVHARLKVESLTAKPLSAGEVEPPAIDEQGQQAASEVAGE